MHGVPSKKSEEKFAFTHAPIPHFGKSGTAPWGVLMKIDTALYSNKKGHTQ
jgi:hypothetical protein